MCFSVRSPISIEPPWALVKSGRLSNAGTSAFVAVSRSHYGRELRRASEQAGHEAIPNYVGGTGLEPVVLGRHTIIELQE